MDYDVTRLDTTKLENSCVLRTPNTMITYTNHTQFHHSIQFNSIHILASVPVRYSSEEQKISKTLYHSIWSELSYVAINYTNTVIVTQGLHATWKTFRDINPNSLRPLYIKKWKSNELKDCSLQYNSSRVHNRQKFSFPSPSTESLRKQHWCVFRKSDASKTG